MKRVDPVEQLEHLLSDGLLERVDSETTLFETVEEVARLAAEPS